MSRSTDQHRNRYGRPTRRSSDLHRANQHASRRRTRRQLRELRYLRLPDLSMPDVTIGAGMGFGVLAVTMVVMGWLA